MIVVSIQSFVFFLTIQISDYVFFSVLHNEPYIFLMKIWKVLFIIFHFYLFFIFISFYCLSALTVSQNQELVTLYEPRHEKTCLRGFRPGKTQTGLRIHRS